MKTVIMGIIVCFNDEEELERCLRLFNNIPYGRENAINKKDLEERTGMSGRELRAVKQILNEKGIPILSSSGKSGYWISTDDYEIREYIRETEHRGKTIILSVSNLKKGLYERNGIKTIPVRQHLRRVHGSGISDNQIKMVL